MGKSKPRHRSNRNHNKSQPTGIPTVQEAEDEDFQSNSENESVIQNIIYQIQSPNMEEKLCGLQTLATLAENPKSIDQIIKLKVLKIVAPLLIDKSSEVRNFTAGVLRNLSASNSMEVCERLVKDDIMTPLIALLQQYSEWNPESSSAEDTDTLLQVFNILWNLCETDETALRYFNSSNLLRILLKCLDYKTVGLDLSIAACQCLNSVSEDNTTVTTALRSHESDLLTLLGVDATNHKLLLLKTLVAGLIANLNPSSPWLSAVLAVMHNALEKDLRAAVCQLSSQLPLDATSQQSEATRKELDNTQALADAQIMSLEILANLIASQDDEMDMESEESVSEGEEELNGWIEAGDTQLLALDTEIHEGLEKYKLVKSVFNKIDPLPLNVQDIINMRPSSKSLLKRMVRLQCRAFLCFNNLVAVVDIDQLGGPQHLYSLVKQICTQTLLPTLNHSLNDTDIELVEASTAAIRAILLRLATIKFTVLGEISSSDLEMMFNIGLCTDVRVQANAIRIVGTLGVLLVNHEFPLVKMAGKYLLDSAEKQLELWLAAEALDSLMDIFAEDSTDEVAAEINLVPRLQALAPRLKAKMRQERRRLGDNYPVISTVMTNLSPFIKYKGGRVAALGNS